MALNCREIKASNKSKGLKLVTAFQTLRMTVMMVEIKASMDDTEILKAAKVVSLLVSMTKSITSNMTEMGVLEKNKLIGMSRMFTRRL